MTTVLNYVVCGVLCGLAGYGCTTTIMAMLAQRSEERYWQTMEHAASSTNPRLRLWFECEMGVRRGVLRSSMPRDARVRLYWHTLARQPDESTRTAVAVRAPTPMQDVDATQEHYDLN